MSFESKSLEFCSPLQRNIRVYFDFPEITNKLVQSAK